VPSLLHEAIVMLFRNRPTLAAELLVRVFGVRVPHVDVVAINEADLTQIVPTEYRADLVVVHGAGPAGAAVVLEVQLDRDENKPFVWPLYQAALRAKLRVPACVLVVTMDDAVARWAATPVVTGQPGVRFAPVVLRVAALPWVTAEEVARAPELALLVVLAHPDEERSAALAWAAIEAVARVDADRAWLYHDIVAARLGVAARAKLEALMKAGNFQPQSEFGKKWYAKGEAEGEAKGEAKGKLEGKLEGKVEAVLRVLVLRGFELTEAQQQRILGCRDLATLDRWLQRAVTATSVHDALG
ncbi:MAG: hypothetical protein HY906_04965, partial [Deltaproteobacteria bacterium]|nr:hypothetical protein [Deltaproteobacteria bacterium]